MPPILSHTRVTATDTDPSRWLLLLHGIYGSGRNWGSLARTFVDERPDWGVILPDLRLHGGSIGFEPPHTLTAAVADVEALVDDLGITPSAVMGHSFGGKVALTYTRLHPEGLSQVWVVDSTLEVREPSGSAWRLIEAVRSLPDRFPSREALVEALEPHGYPAPLANWLGMNLEREGDELRWRLDWEGAEEMLRDYFQTDVWQVIESPPAGIEIHVIRATESDSITDADATRISRAGERNHSSCIHPLKGGHWINVDNPEGVVALLAGALP